MSISKKIGLITTNRVLYPPPTYQDRVIGLKPVEFLALRVPELNAEEVQSHVHVDVEAWQDVLQDVLNEEERQIDHYIKEGRVKG